MNNLFEEKTTISLYDVSATVEKIKKSIEDDEKNFNKVYKTMKESKVEWLGKAARKAYTFLDEAKTLLDNENKKIALLNEFLSKNVVPSYEQVELTNSELADKFL